MGHSIFLAEWLSSEQNRGYGPLPIPQVRDEQITKLIRAWMNLDHISRTESASEITEMKQARVLRAYGERMASFAVRERDADFLVLGLIAVGLDGWRYDWRENLLIIPLFYDAATRLGVSPEITFGKTYPFLSEKVVNALEAFLRRSPHDRSLAVMGYKAGADDQGFRYIRTW
jgi:hypothetical protein